MATSYEKIFNTFLRKINDVEFANQIQFNQEYAVDDMTGWLHSAVAKIGRIEQSSITFDDDTQTIAEDLSDIDIEIYALGMKVEWLTPIVDSKLNLAQMFGGKEEKFYSQSSHLSQLQSMLANDKTEIRKLVRDYGYRHNLYIDDGT